jgi:hypothetical protein
MSSFKITERENRSEASISRVNKNDVVDETWNYQRIQCTTPTVKWVVYGPAIVSVNHGKSVVSKS